MHAYVSRYFPEIVSEYTERNGKPPGVGTLAQRPWRADRYDEKNRFLDLLPAARALVSATDYAEYK